MNIVKRAKIRPSMKLKIAAGQKYTCFYCKNILGAQFHIDHIIPLCLGGEDRINNLNALCPNCHSEKTVNDMQKYYDKQKEIRTGKSRFFDKMAIEYVGGAPNI